MGAADPDEVGHGTSLRISSRVLERKVEGGKGWAKTTGRMAGGIPQQKGSLCMRRQEGCGRVRLACHDVGKRGPVGVVRIETRRQQTKDGLKVKLRVGLL